MYTMGTVLAVFTPSVAGAWLLPAAYPPAGTPSQRTTTAKRFGHVLPCWLGCRPAFPWVRLSLHCVQGNSIYFLQINSCRKLGSLAAFIIFLRALSLPMGLFLRMASAILRTTFKLRGELSFFAFAPSSRNITSSIQCNWFSTDQWPRMMSPKFSALVSKLLM